MKSHFRIDIFLWIICIFADSKEHLWGTTSAKPYCSPDWSEFRFPFLSLASIFEFSVPWRFLLGVRWLLPGPLPSGRHCLEDTILPLGLFVSKHFPWISPSKFCSMLLEYRNAIYHQFIESSLNEAHISTPLPTLNK